jgi:hypothetical protein
LNNRPNGLFTKIFLYISLIYIFFRGVITVIMDNVISCYIFCYSLCLIPVIFSSYNAFYVILIVYLNLISWDLVSAGVVGFYQRHVILYTRLENLAITNRIFVRNMFRHAFITLGGPKTVTPIIGGIVTGVAIEGLKEATQTMRHNSNLAHLSEEAQKQREFQSQEAQKQREFQSQEAQKQRELQQFEAQKQRELELRKFELKLEHQAQEAQKQREHELKMRQMDLDSKKMDASKGGWFWRR